MGFLCCFQRVRDVTQGAPQIAGDRAPAEEPDPVAFADPARRLAAVGVGERDEPAVLGDGGAVEFAVQLSSPSLHGPHCARAGWPRGCVAAKRS